MSKTKRGPHLFNEYRERLQKYLPVIRTAYGLRVEDLAQLLDISVVTLVNYSSGTNMTISMYYAILYVLTCSELNIGLPQEIAKYFIFSDVPEKERNKLYHRLEQAMNSAESKTMLSRNKAVINEFLKWKEEEASEEPSV